MQIQEKFLMVTLVTMTQFRAIWLQWHFSDFPISNFILKFSCLQRHSISHSLTVTLFGRSQGCHCNRLLLYHLASSILSSLGEKWIFIMSHCWIRNLSIPKLLLSTLQASILLEVVHSFGRANQHRWTTTSSSAFGATQFWIHQPFFAVIATRYYSQCSVDSCMSLKLKDSVKIRSSCQFTKNREDIRFIWTENSLL